MGQGCSVADCHEKTCTRRLGIDDKSYILVELELYRTYLRLIGIFIDRDFPPHFSPVFSSPAPNIIKQTANRYSRQITYA